MSTTYPTDIDTFANPAASDTMDGGVGGPSAEHDIQHGNLNDSVNAIETLLGTTGNFKFAPINSPAFIGTPSAPTPPIGDNTTLLATTDFVQAALFVQNFIGVPWAAQLSNSATMDYSPIHSDRGRVIEMSSSSTLNVQLNAGLFGSGDWLDIVQAGVGAVTFVAGSGFTIDSLNGVITTSGQWAVVRVRFRSPSEAIISGDLF